MTAFESIKALEFYVTQSDNKPPELHCRVWGIGAERERMDYIARDLNAAIAPIKDRWMKTFLLDAENRLHHMLIKNGIPR